MARFVNHWCDLTLHPALRPLLLLSVYKFAAEKDQAYFRESREKMLGITLEELCRDRPAALEALSKTMTPIEGTLAESEFLGGGGPNYADYILFGSLQWARVVSPEPVLAHDSAVARWFERMLDLFDGYGRKAATMRHALKA